MLRTEAARRRAPLLYCADDYTGPLTLRGVHQRQNAAAAKAAIKVLGSQGLAVDDDAIVTGLASTRWPSRLEEMEGVLLARGPQR